MIARGGLKVASHFARSREKRYDRTMNTPEPSGDTSRTWPERGVSILNGMFGDYLQQRGNDLAIAMSFRHRGLPLSLEGTSLRAACSPLSGRLCIFVHGLCCNESVWNFPATAAETQDDSYGRRLRRDAGFTPFFVRYNTGLPVAKSGVHLATLLSELVGVYPLPVTEIALIGHSMGGLVIRAACDPARAEAESWLGHVRHAIYIAAPHEGADLERFAHLTTGALHAIPNQVTRLVGDILNLRSRGVKDLRDGQPLADLATLPWLASAYHHLLMGTLTRDPAHPVGRLFGDALVRVPESDEQPASRDIVVFPGVHHLALAHDASVYRRILWICAGQ